jgi:hypothetical protein
MMQLSVADLKRALRLSPVAAVMVTNPSSERRAFKVAVQSSGVHHYDISPSLGYLDGNSSCKVSISVRLTTSVDHSDPMKVVPSDQLIISSAPVPRPSSTTFQIEDLFCGSRSHEHLTVQRPICIEEVDPITVPISSVRIFSLTYDTTRQLVSI